MPFEDIQPSTAPKGAGLSEAIAELQKLRVRVLSGAGAAVNIPVAGLETDDTILYVHRVVDPGAIAGASVIDHTAQASIPSPGNLQVSVATNVNAGDRLVFAFYDTEAG